MPNQLSIVSFSQKNNKDKKEECPICYRLVDASQIETHADRCADETTAEELQIISSQVGTDRIRKYWSLITDWLVTSHVT